MFVDNKKYAENLKSTTFNVFMWPMQLHDLVKLFCITSNEWLLIFLVLTKFLCLLDFLFTCLSQSVGVNCDTIHPFTYLQVDWSRLASYNMNHVSIRCKNGSWNFNVCIEPARDSKKVFMHNILYTWSSPPATFYYQKYKKV